ncbi:BQ5605_C009g05531 [Microbotryum silenes-dioicae]|uniref:BQ5605_C009g05531 protein n=1 Tax=Microbotryum silenes-dioicae TaxID=796604 RepID=A0A2X0MHI8_9BASI|nr:BQ5605_C009g05531 [Microbotryum silenes-dioicae]
MEFYKRAALILDALDEKKGSVKGLCMAEAKRSREGRPGEAARFLKVTVEVLKYRPHLKHLLDHSAILTKEPALFVAPVTTTAPTKGILEVKSAAAASKMLKKQEEYQNKRRGKQQRPPPTPASLAMVMIHDMLFAKRGITLPKEHKVRKQVERYKVSMEKETEKERKRKRCSSNEGLQIALPENVAASIEGIGKGKKRAKDAETGEDAGALGSVRWLRVNTLKWTVEEAVEWFDDQRWEMVNDVETMIETAQTKSKVFALDAHIEPLLALPASLSLPSLEPFKDGRLIAQDKASCMPAWVLLSHLLAEEDLEREQEEQAQLDGTAPTDSLTFEERGDLELQKKKKRGVRVLDATAAPGNKTTMAAAMAGEFGKVVAVERDQGRFKVLKDMCKKAGASNVTPMNIDFLSIDPADIKFKNITHFLVDPSCSGSGIPSRLDHLLPTEPEAEQATRIRALSNFQLTILSHAMRFSGARRVVYSTCSVWAQEDEGVVMRLLAKKEFQDKGWRLATRDEVIPTWERRGRVEECGGDQNIADSVIRCLPEDQSNGFFVACFIRDEDAAIAGDQSMDGANVLPNEANVEGESTELTHAQRQELFKAKARAKGGKGGPRGGGQAVTSSTSPTKSAPKKVEAVVEKKKSGKKAAYLAEKKRRQEGGSERAGKKNRVD